MNRRNFLKSMLLGGAMLGIETTGISRGVKKGLTKITLLHTNDLHSQIEPFSSDHHRFAGRGGFAQRASLIKKIRETEKNVLLFDAGDIYQGTPYFNYFKGELEFKLMSDIKYDAATVGNHEFDNGLEGLEKNLKHSNFPFISSNYDFSKTILNGKIEEYKVFEIEGINIGVFGLGVNLNGLVSPALYGETKYLNPFEKAAEMTHFLKNQKNCEIIICLSHMGYSYSDNRPSDVKLAKESLNIDIIIGGHSHTTLEKAIIMRNRIGKDVIIGQTGYAGVNLGRIDIYIQKKIGLKFADGHAIKVLNKQA